jgi:RNA polymerase sigma-70 factor, ECF subfamily
MTTYQGGPAGLYPQHSRAIDESDPGDLATLLEAVARGDHGAFDLVYERLRWRIVSRVRGVLRDPAQAEEVTQEVLLEVWRTAHRYDRTRGSGTVWALTIAHRRAVDRVRAAAASAARDQWTAEPDDPADEVAEAVQSRLDREFLLRCLDQLSDLQREAITLAYYEEHSYSQVAAILDVPLSTVKARIRAGLIRLRGCMIDAGWPGPTSS